ncbi:hypothetical protein LCGC14_0737650 [marine sediment metagenome]|uniref:Uncharacterized protein n=1 Tax=marine sediment metagenome TaxID=412755 RepID=A0A0F9QBS1_9ZZZZ
MNKQNKPSILSDFWLKICLLPLVIGFALIIAGITITIFKVIGWLLFFWGLVWGLIYVYNFLYKPHKEKVDEFKYKVLKFFRGKIK